MSDPVDLPPGQPLAGAWPAPAPALVAPDDAILPQAPSAPAGVRPAQRWLSLMEVFLCSGLPTQLLIALGLQGLGWSPLDAGGALSLRYVAALSLADTILILLLARALLVSGGEAPREVFFGSTPPGREVLLGVAVLPAILVGVGGLALALRAMAPWLHNVPENPLEALMRDPVGLAVFAVVVVVAGGVREEVQRAFVLHRFRQHLGGALVGLWVFSLAFGLGHLLQGYDAAILTGVLGLAWGALYLRRGSIVAPMVSHSLFNLAEVLRQALAP